MPQSVHPSAAVVIDVLRATTTIAWALHNGAEAIQAFADIEALQSAAAAWPADARLLVGERGGQKLEGFDLGNSPVTVGPETVAGKRLFMSTTNGTRALDRVRDVPLLMTAALPNREAVAQRLHHHQPEQEIHHRAAPLDNAAPSSLKSGCTVQPRLQPSPVDGNPRP